MSQSKNPLIEVAGLGQSIWLDNIRRDLIVSGALKKLIDEDGLKGLTSNPAIFAKSIAQSDLYTERALALWRMPSMDATKVYEHLAIPDIQDVADLLLPVYQSSRAKDGYVSLEVSPLLANDTQGTVTEARRLWSAVNRPNLMVKIPATPAGIEAIQTAIGEGININVTLLFAQEAYEKVARAYLTGLQHLAQKGGDLSRVASVASFFISRIDSLVDSKLEKKPALQSLQGKVAIANAKVTYQKYKEICQGAEWQALAAKGAQPQRLLWASTSTKNPKYKDTYYIEELIGNDTVNTVPPSTLDAFRDHGVARASLEEGVDDARQVLTQLAEGGVSLKEVTDQLITDAVKLFADPFNELLQAVVKHQAAVKEKPLNGIELRLPAALARLVDQSLKEWQKDRKGERLWNSDASLWTSKDEAKWTGWLNIIGTERSRREEFKTFAKEVKALGPTDVVVLGMGGSSLCPEVLAETFGKQSGFPTLHVLDSTDPAQLKSVEKRINLDKSLFIVSSKSGTTLEPNIFKQYFFEKVTEKFGKAGAGKRFIAITDPGSQMEEVAKADGFGHIFYGLPSIGGRYSALSDFGLIPAAAMGLDVGDLVDRAALMSQCCAGYIPAPENPGIILGSVLGVAGRNGIDKVTLIASPGIRDIGAWLEQLIAESTGKSGLGLIPVDQEPLRAMDHYGKDRLFVHLRLNSETDAGQDAFIAAAEKAGHPVVIISLADKRDLAQEFFRWEVATAVAGSILGIHPFNQPDVEASKVETKKITSEFEKTGHLPDEKALVVDSALGIQLFTDPRNAQRLSQWVSTQPATVAGILKAHLSQLKAGDYFALLAFIEMSEGHWASLQKMREAVVDRYQVATCLGFGPRFLHSTGQAYKGGPNSGVFLQITCDDLEDISVPAQKFTFGVVKAAQARGDFAVLAQRERRALRIHLGKNVEAGLAFLGRELCK